jgi:ribokinase
VSGFRIPPSQRRFDAVIGTGGIGTGMFFALSGNHTLGREESRAVRIVDRKDYCKLHIVSHYVRSLLGPSFRVLPIGMVGDDDAGKNLLSEMTETGIRTVHVRKARGARTLFSFCLVYPDGSGCNLTTDDSASAMLTPENVREAEGEFEKAGSRGIGLALPEVPIESRKQLLELATTHGLYRIASFTTQEMRIVTDERLLDLVDHLACNIDEAESFCASLHGRIPSGKTPEQIAKKTAALLMEKYPLLGFSITAGRNGSWITEKRGLHRIPACSVETRGTAGAGDAYISGFIAGLACGLGPVESGRLGSLTGALSVTSPHTIHKGLDADGVRRLALESGFVLTGGLKALLLHGC